MHCNSMQNSILLRSSSASVLSDDVDTSNFIASRSVRTSFSFMYILTRNPSFPRPQTVISPFCPIPDSTVKISPKRTLRTPKGVVEVLAPLTIRNPHTSQQMSKVGRSPRIRKFFEKIFLPLSAKFREILHSIKSKKKFFKKISAPTF